MARGGGWNLARGAQGGGGMEGSAPGGMPSAEAAHERLQRQVEELGVLRDIFEGDVQISGEDAAQEWLAGGGSTVAPSLLGARVEFSGPGRVVCELVLPEGYPEAADPLVWVEADGEGWAEAARAAIGQVLNELGGGGEAGRERLLDCVQAAEEALRDAAEGQALATAITDLQRDGVHAAEEEGSSSGNDLLEGAPGAALLEALQRRGIEGPRELGRRLCYSHHIIAPGKRKCVVEWAVQLGLGGFSKIGWPGIIVVEGAEEDVEQYTRALQRLRWKHFTVRGEETVQLPPGDALDEHRLLPPHFIELPEDGMSQLAAQMKAAGCHELFLTSMKIYRHPRGEAGDDPARAEPKRKPRRKNKAM